MSAKKVASFASLRTDVAEILGQINYATMMTVDRRGRPRSRVLIAVWECAIALLEGTAGEHQFTDAKVVDLAVRDLMSRITPVASDELNHSEAVAVGRTKDGRAVEVVVEHATGTPQNRITDADLAAKFHSLVDPVLGASQAAQLEAAVWKVAELQDVSQLVDLATSH